MRHVNDEECVIALRIHEARLLRDGAFGAAPCSCLELKFPAGGHAVCRIFHIVKRGLT
jgi:hypothetical protein